MIQKNHIKLDEHELRIKELEDEILILKQEIETLKTS
jgi:uncharacterized small protein (DUF1192 family)